MVNINITFSIHNYFVITQQRRVKNCLHLPFFYINISHQHNHSSEYIYHANMPDGKRMQMSLFNFIPSPDLAICEVFFALINSSKFVYGLILKCLTSSLTEEIFIIETPI